MKFTIFLFISFSFLQNPKIRFRIHLCPVCWFQLSVEKKERKICFIFDPKEKKIFRYCFDFYLFIYISFRFYHQLIQDFFFVYCCCCCRTNWINFFGSRLQHCCFLCLICLVVVISFSTHSIEKQNSLVQNYIWSVLSVFLSFFFGKICVCVEKHW